MHTRIQGKTAMHFAARYNRAENVRVLAAADPTLVGMKSRRGEAPIHCACMSY